MKCDQICCTTCPSECRISVFSQGAEIIKIEGNGCKRGVVFAKQEMTDPVRTLTSTVLLKGTGQTLSIPVKSSQPMPLRSVEAAMKQIRKAVLTSSCRMGDVVIADICGLGLDIVACKTVKG